MVSTLSLSLQGCALASVAALLAGCTQVVVGAPRFADDGPPAPIADLLVDPARFPAHYRATVLDGAAVDRARQDIDGVRDGSAVTPHDCAPPAHRRGDAVAAQGVDDATASRLIVVVTRPAPPLRDRVDQLRACPSFTAQHGGDTSTVRVTLLPAPPVDADDTYASEQTVTTPDSVRHTLTLVAQIDETRISVTWLQDPAVGEPDTSSLDTLFSDAVLKVRRGR